MTSGRTRRETGYYPSTSRGKTFIGIKEPALFVEPGLLLTNPDGTHYYMAVPTMPIARPGFKELLGAVEFAVDMSYPMRGEYDSPVQELNTGRGTGGGQCLERRTAP